MKFKTKDILDALSDEIFGLNNSNITTELPVGLAPLGRNLKELKCTCGCHKTYGTDWDAHSDWCDLWVLKK